VVSKPSPRLNFCVGPRDSILEILNIFLPLNPSPRLDFEPDIRGIGFSSHGAGPGIGQKGAFSKGLVTRSELPVIMINPG
jgi:hypothetical protein